MLKRFVLVLFLASCIIMQDIDIVEFIEKNLDYGINPCDDFYSHSCPKKAPFSDLLSTAYSKQVKKLPNRLKRIETKLERLIRKRDVLADATYFEEEYLDKCLANTTAANQMLQELNEEFLLELKGKCCHQNLALDSDCERASKNLQIQMKDRVNPKDGHTIASIINNWSKILTQLKNYQALVWLQENAGPLEELRTMFNEFKYEFAQLFEQTPWIKSSGTLRTFQKIFDQIKLNDFEQFKSFTDPIIEEIENAWDKCESRTSDSALFYCISKIHPKHYVKKSLHDIHYYFRESIISISNPLISLFSSNLPPAIKREADSKDFQKYGKLFLGVPFAYEVFKNNYECQLNKSVRGYTRCWTPAQLFFYAANFFNCGKFDDDSKSVINTIFAQIPDFGKVFECNAGDKMLLSFDKQISIFGKYAPEK
ncbi:unnamed protein product [Caenorhabditis angaria]|uniref:Peptidase M13 C-terminal domain-containing protein n=1 Tax=Caenorhabditis angaria TaxID=860376 RepID=A0A9P1J112_9PELO|nr:unnamed protein product [Caenorhabditis angaria]